MDVAIVEVPVGSSEALRPWPVYWTAVWVGSLTSVALALLFGLLAAAIGAEPVGGRLGPEDLGFADLAAAVCGAFFAFVAGGWVASRIAGIRTAETGALHGALAWLLSVPMLLVLVALGAGTLFGVWYAGLAGTPAWVATPPASGPAAAELAREAAGGALTALLIGLVGAAIGGWLGSGESMNPFDYRERARLRSALPMP
jgi:hypothetical protein